MKNFNDLKFTIEQIEYLERNLSWLNNIRVDEWLANLKASIIYKNTYEKYNKKNI